VLAHIIRGLLALFAEDGLKVLEDIRDVFWVETITTAVQVTDHSPFWVDEDCEGMVPGGSNHGQSPARTDVACIERRGVEQEFVLAEFGHHVLICRGFKDVDRSRVGNGLEEVVAI
jgi:hypothetical protein